MSLDNLVLTEPPLVFQQENVGLGIGVTGGDLKDIKAAVRQQINKLKNWTNENVRKVKAAATADFKAGLYENVQNKTDVFAEQIKNTVEANKTKGDIYIKEISEHVPIVDTDKEYMKKNISDVADMCSHSVEKTQHGIALATRALILERHPSPSFNGSTDEGTQASTILEFDRMVSICSAPDQDAVRAAEEANTEATEIVHEVLGDDTPQVVRRVVHSKEDLMEEYKSKMGGNPLNSEETDRLVTLLKQSYDTGQLSFGDEVKTLLKKVVDVFKARILNNQIDSCTIVRGSDLSEAYLADSRNTGSGLIRGLFNGVASIIQATYFILKVLFYLITIFMMFILACVFAFGFMYIITPFLSFPLAIYWFVTRVKSLTEWTWSEQTGGGVKEQVGWKAYERRKSKFITGNAIRYMRARGLESPSLDSNAAAYFKSWDLGLKLRELMNDLAKETVESIDNDVKPVDNDQSGPTQNSVSEIERAGEPSFWDNVVGFFDSFWPWSDSKADKKGNGVDGSGIKVNEPSVIGVIILGGAIGSVIALV